MANGNLIQGARRIGQARRFVDYGKIIGDNIKSPALTQYFEEARAQYFQNIKEKEAKLANFINQKAYMDTSKINEYNVDMASDFLSKKKTEYLEAANIAATAKVGSEEYVNAVSTMNAANNAIKNFDVELQAWRDDDGEKTLDFDNNKISKGNLNYGDIMETMQDPNSENGPSFIVNDNGKVTMVIRDAEGNIIKELERQEYFLKVTDDQFYKLGEIGDKYYNVGLNGLALDEKRARQDVRRWMGEDHTKLLSLARDDFDEMPAFIKDEDLETVIFNGLTGRELLQKNNQTELKSFLVDKYIGALTDRHTAGTGDFNTIKARKEDEKEVVNIGTLLEEISSQSIVEGGLETVDLSNVNLPEGQENFFNQNEPIYRKVEGVNEEASQVKFAEKLATQLNSPKYGSQKTKYYTKDQFISLVLGGKLGFGADIEGDPQVTLKNFFKKNFPNTYLFTVNSDTNMPVGVDTDYKNPNTQTLKALFRAADVKL